MTSYISCSYIGEGDESEVVEIGIVGESEARFHSYIRPTEVTAIDKGDLNRWGVDHRSLLRAPRLDNIFELLTEKLDTGPLYGYNLPGQLSALINTASARDIEGAGHDIKSPEWRDLKEGAREHSAVQGQDPSLRRVCKNLEITIGRHGLKGAVHRAILCRRLHDVLLKDPEESAPYSVIGSTGKTEGKSKSHTRRFDDASIAENGQAGSDKKESSSGQRSLLYVSSDELRHPPANRTLPVFFGVDTIGSPASKIVVRIAAVSGRGKTILDAAVRPEVDDLFSKRLDGSASQHDSAQENEGLGASGGSRVEGPMGHEKDQDERKGSNAAETNSKIEGEAVPVRREEILFAPTFERVMNEILSRLNRSGPGETRAWVYRESGAPEALRQTAEASGLTELKKRIEEAEWHCLTEELRAPVAQKGLEKVAADFGFDLPGEGSTARTRAHQKRAIYDHLQEG
jgi:hypothetical protein